MTAQAEWHWSAQRVSGILGQRGVKQSRVLRRGLRATIQNHETSPLIPSARRSCREAVCAPHGRARDGWCARLCRRTVLSANEPGRRRPWRRNIHRSPPHRRVGHGAFRHERLVGDEPVGRSGRSLHRRGPADTGEQSARRYHPAPCRDDDSVYSDGDRLERRFEFQPRGDSAGSIHFCDAHRHGVRLEPPGESHQRRDQWCPRSAPPTTPA